MTYALDLMTEIWGRALHARNNALITTALAAVLIVLISLGTEDPFAATAVLILSTLPIPMCVYFVLILNLLDVQTSHLKAPRVEGALVFTTVWTTVVCVLAAQWLLGAPYVLLWGPFLTLLSVRALTGPWPPRGVVNFAIGVTLAGVVHLIAKSFP